MHYFFPLLSLLAWIGGHYANGILIWLSFLTLGIWGILALNTLQMIVQLFTRHRRKAWLPLLAILLHTDYLLAVWQPSFPGRNTLPEGAQPLTVVTYNTTHFFWDKQQTMQEAAAYIRQLQPDVVCMQEAPDASYYQMDSIRMAFDYVVYRYISGRTDHLPMMISSRYPLRAVRTLFFKNSVNLAMIADVCMPHDTVRVFCNHLETTSVNQYRGQIQATSKPWLFRLKAGVKLILQMKENFRKRAAQADYIAEEIRRSPIFCFLFICCRGMWRLQRYPRLLYLSSDERCTDRWIPRCRQRLSIHLPSAQTHLADRLYLLFRRTERSFV